MTASDKYMKTVIYSQYLQSESIMYVSSRLPIVFVRADREGLGVLVKRYVERELQGSVFTAECHRVQDTYTAGANLNMYVVVRMVSMLFTQAPSLLRIGFPRILKEFV